MTSSGAIGLGLRMAFGAALAAALLAHSAAPSLANGVHVGSREVYAGEAGPYRIAVSTAPATGLMHFIVLLSETEGGAPVVDAAISMEGAFVVTGEGAFGTRMPDTGTGAFAGTGEGAGARAGPVEGYETPEGPVWFAADLLVERAGLWDFTLTVDSPQGREQVTFTVPVVEASGGNLTLIALIVVALAILGFVLGNRMFGRRRRRTSGRRPQG